MKKLTFLFALACILPWGCRKETPNATSIPKRFAGIMEDAFDGAVRNSQGEFTFVTTLDHKRFVTKSTADGNLVWQKEIDPFHYATTHIATNTEGEIFVMGTVFTTPPNPFVQIIKMDQNGEYLWTLDLKDTSSNQLEYRGVNIICTGDDQVVVSLQINASNGPVESRIYKITRNGTIVWNKAVSDIFCLQMAPTRDNGFLMVSTNDEFHLQRYSSSGTLQWERPIYFPGLSRDQIRCVKELENGNVVVVGKLLVDDQIAMSVMAYKSDGYPLWFFTKNYLNAEDMVITVTADASGNIYAGGITRHHGSEAQGIVVKLNPEGKEIWHTLFGGRNKDYACSLFLNSANQLTILGNSWNYADGESIEKVIMLRMDEKGQIQ